MRDGSCLIVAVDLYNCHSNDLHSCINVQIDVYVLASWCKNNCTRWTAGEI